MRPAALILPVWLVVAAGGCSIKAVDGKPGALVSQGRKLYAAKDYRAAAGYFEGVKKYHPDSVEAEEGIFMLAECYRRMRDAELAFANYKKLIDDYPSSRFLVATAEGEYALGNDYLEGRIPGFLFFGRPRGEGIEILEHMQIHFQHNRLADDALLRVANYHLEEEDYESAVDTLRRLLSDYPRSKHALRARFELAEALLRLNRGADYDTRILHDARRAYSDFIATVRQAGLAKQYTKQVALAEERIEFIRNRLAERHYRIGRFYERTNEPVAALLYYESGYRAFPKTDFGQKCNDRFRELRGDDLIPEAARRDAEAGGEG